ncbi:hypothetical protein E2562_033652 [Oryza meyeriana var. granulata]|uniref:Uncharacterized protein n=1 Tax=Oryza meyeriana var. granulata TaxID=110450 RepID=A0A6G1CAP5_9ORYZ|nr:hypothetical protein E2562_033652 [Oryza meyeriana var. granulata]
MRQAHFAVLQQSIVVSPWPKPYKVVPNLGKLARRTSDGLGLKLASATATLLSISSNSQNPPYCRKGYFVHASIGEETPLSQECWQETWWWE